MARDLVAADRCSIWLIDARSSELWTQVAHGSNEIRVPLGHGLVGACVSSGDVILVNDTAQDPRFLSQIDRASGYLTRSVLVVPLRAANGSVLGALQLLNKEGGFTTNDVELVNLAAAYSANAIETQRLRAEADAARLLRKELEIARDVQQRLLPQNPPALPSLDYATYFRPARFVGGDYYDLLPMPDGSLFFTLGDVSGKGVAAAVLMASIQAALRAQVSEPPANLGALLTSFNRAVYSFSTSDKYTTLFAALWQPAARTLTYVNAGGCPPMLCRASSALLERLEAGGCPLGLLGPARYQHASVQLDPGDALLCFSDGISEATNSAEEIWEESELAALFAAHAHLPAQQIVDTVVAAADAFTGDAEQSDDMTVLTLRVL